MAKLPAMAALTFVPFFLTAADWKAVVYLAGLAALLCALALAAKVPPGALFRGSGGLAAMCLFVALLRSVGINPIRFNAGGFREALLFAAAIMAAFAAGSLFFACTPLGRIMKALAAVERAVSFGRREGRVSLAVTLMLAFMPRFFALWEDVTLAWTARGGRLGVRSLGPLLQKVIVRLMFNAADTAAALAARGG
jgi:biotin transport system permease protein